MKQKRWVIYCHINKENGKRYIGQTKQDYISSRWQPNQYKHSKLFYSAIIHYGWDAFEHIILEDNIVSQEQANERERYWIAYYHTCYYDKDCWGYNLDTGGNTFPNYQVNIIKDSEWKRCKESEYLLIYKKQGWRKPTEQEQKEHKAELRRQWRIKNAEHYKLQNKYYAEIYKEKSKQYHQERKEHYNELKREYYKKNKAKVLEWNKNWRDKQKNKK